MMPYLQLPAEERTVPETIFLGEPQRPPGPTSLCDLALLGFCYSVFDVVLWHALFKGPAKQGLGCQQIVLWAIWEEALASWRTRMGPAQRPVHIAFDRTFSLFDRVLAVNFSFSLYKRTPRSPSHRPLLFLSPGPSPSRPHDAGDTLGCALRR